MTSSTNTKSPIDERISRLEAIGKIDPQAAQDAAWAWIERLGARLPGHAAEYELGQLFAAGEPAAVNGQTEGMLVGWTTPDAALNPTGRGLHAIFKTATTRLGLMPWLGKKFDRSARDGGAAVSGADRPRRRSAARRAAADR
jgi:hypothetical protein